jgi:hypothetical protein
LFLEKPLLNCRGFFIVLKKGTFTSPCWHTLKR